MTSEGIYQDTYSSEWKHIETGNKVRVGHVFMSRKDYGDYNNYYYGYINNLMFVILEHYPSYDICRVEMIIE